MAWHHMMKRGNRRHVTHVFFSFSLCSFLFIVFSLSSNSHWSLALPFASLVLLRFSFPTHPLHFGSLCQCRSVGGPEGWGIGFPIGPSPWSFVGRPSWTPSSIPNLTTTALFTCMPLHLSLHIPHVWCGCHARESSVTATKFYNHGRIVFVILCQLIKRMSCKNAHMLSKCICALLAWFHRYMDEESEIVMCELNLSHSV